VLCERVADAADGVVGAADGLLGDDALAMFVAAETVPEAG
jgi:hypothetical protein